MNQEHKPSKEKSQHKDDLYYRNNRELFYSFDPEQKCYTRKVDFQYQANQVIIKQGWDVLEERIDDFKNRVESGELSPLAYYMEKNQMEVPMLAAYSGFRKWKVKRHLKPKHFKNLSEEVLQKYASVFDISVAQLKSPDFLTNHTESRKNRHDQT